MSLPIATGRVDVLKFGIIFQISGHLHDLSMGRSAGRSTHVNTTDSRKPARCNTLPPTVTREKALAVQEGMSTVEASGRCRA